MVSLQVSSYLRSKKFKVSPTLVKKYFEEHILPVLHVEVPFTISVRTAARWMNKMGFYYKQYKKEDLAPVWGIRHIVRKPIDNSKLLEEVSIMATTAG